MTVTVRFNAALEERLRKMAEAEGVSLSEVIRRAAILYWQRHAGSSLELRLSDVLGKVKSRGGRARQTGQAFRKVIRRRD
jgi:hypothetical protein